MRIFVSEYATSGANTDGDSAKAALAPEGAAMLRALAGDAAAIPDWRVAITWDAALEPFDIPGVTVHGAESQGDELRLFEELATEADATLVIAPEFGGILENRSRKVLACGGRLVGPRPDAISLCGDKLALARHLAACGIPTIETAPCDFASLRGVPPQGFVIKPRDGAGSIDTFLVRTPGDLAAAEATFAAAAAISPPIIQPYTEGLSLSIAAIVGFDGAELLPLCRQRIELGKRLRYLGGSVPADVDGEEIRDLVLRTLQEIPGLYGFVGIDVLLPAAGDAPLIVEINPRLTTSYLGYRQLAVDNLAERILDPHGGRTPVEWRSGRVEFSPTSRTEHQQ